MFESIQDLNPINEKFSRELHEFNLKIKIFHENLSFLASANFEFA